MGYLFWLSELLRQSLREVIALLAAPALHHSPTSGTQHASNSPGKSVIKWLMTLDRTRERVLCWAGFTLVSKHPNPGDSDTLPIRSLVECLWLERQPGQHVSIEQMPICQIFHAPPQKAASSLRQS